MNGHLPAAMMLSLGLLLSSVASADTFRITFSKATDLQTLKKLKKGDALVVAGNVAGDVVENVRNTVEFGAKAKTIKITTAWQTGTLDGSIALQDVNVKILDTSNKVVANDVPDGEIAGVAVSRIFFGGLIPGETYRIVLTGVKAVASNYMMSIEAGVAAR